MYSSCRCWREFTGGDRDGGGVRARESLPRPVPRSGAYAQISRKIAKGTVTRDHANNILCRKTGSDFFRRYDVRCVFPCSQEVEIGLIFFIFQAL